MLWNLVDNYRKHSAQDSFIVLLGGHLCRTIKCSYPYSSRIVIVFIDYLTFVLFFLIFVFAIEFELLV